MQLPKVEYAEGTNKVVITIHKCSLNKRFVGKGFFVHASNFKFLHYSRFLYGSGFVLLRYSLRKKIYFRIKLSLKGGGFYSLK